jgi:hypothetical protein
MGNITAQDSSYATVNISSTSSISDELYASNFGFSIPSNAVINGITATVNRRSSTTHTTDAAAYLVKAGVVGTTNRATGTSIPLSVATDKTFGSSTDLWGDTWLASDINNSGFGVAYASGTDSVTTGLVSVDDITLTISYTVTNVISYKDNPTPTSGAAITYQSGTDPTDSGTYTAQSYQEADGFGVTSAIAANTDGEWDLSLYDNGAPAGTTYCLRTVKSDGTPLDTYSQYPMITTASANSPPSTPTLSSPSSGATGVSTTPTFSFSDTDPNSDDIQFKVNLFQSDCSTSVATYDMASGQSSWSPTFNGTAGSGLTYTSSTSGSGVSFTPSSALSNSTTYCWSVSAKDPGGTNTTTTSGTRSFTTGASGAVNIGGGINIGGGTNIY